MCLNILIEIVIECFFIKRLVADGLIPGLRDIMPVTMETFIDHVKASSKKAAEILNFWLILWLDLSQFYSVLEAMLYIGLDIGDMRSVRPEDVRWWTKYITHTGKRGT